MSKKLFRESALERLSSPEQLDQILQVTSTKGWMALFSLWLILAGVVAWSVFGRVPTQEEGHGMIQAAQGLHQVEATGTGRLTAIKKRVDDPVAKGEIVASVDKRDLEDQRDELRVQLTALRDQARRLKEQEDKEKSLQDSVARFERERLQQVISFDDEKIARLKERRVTVQKLIDQGIATQLDIERVDDEMEGARKEAATSRLATQQVDAKSLSADAEREREQLTRQLKIEEMDGRIALLEGRIKREGEVVSTMAGRVLEVRAAEGAVVAVGDPVLLIEPTGEQRKQQLEAVLYVSAKGQQITKGDEVMLVPSTVKREEHGSLLGKVEWVAPNPTSMQAMVVTLKDQALAERFSRDIGSPREIRVTLTPDPATATGFKWTSVTGPPKPLTAGTLCSGRVTVKRQSPLSLVIPIFGEEPRP